MSNKILLEAQTLPDSSRKQLFGKVDKLFKWKAMKVHSKGYILSLDCPYNLWNKHRTSDEYISITVALPKPYNRSKYISFVLPDHINVSKGLWIGFGNLERGKEPTTPHGQSGWFHLKFNKHWANNHTVASILWGGVFVSQDLKDTIHILSDFLKYNQLYVFFYDSNELKKMGFPMRFFQNKYETLFHTVSYPVYGAGIPADTALTPIERKANSRHQRSYSSKASY